MKYKKEVKTKEFGDALSLTSERINELKVIIGRAYDQNWHKDGPNVDQINAYVAPFLNTPEEAFYAAWVIISDVYGALMGKK